MDQLGPLILVLFNSTFIPLMVSTTGNFSDHELKSDRHIKNMRRYYFFLMLNTILLPLTGLTTIESFKDRMVQGGFFQMWDSLTQNLIKSSTFFIRYVMSCTFLSSCFAIFDIGH